MGTVELSEKLLLNCYKRYTWITCPGDLVSKVPMEGGGWFIGMASTKQAIHFRWCISPVVGITWQFEEGEWCNVVGAVGTKSKLEDVSEDDDRVATGGADRVEGGSTDSDAENK